MDPYVLNGPNCSPRAAAAVRELTQTSTHVFMNAYTARRRHSAGTDRTRRDLGEFSNVLVQHDGALAAQRFEQALRVYIYIMCVCIRAHEYTITGRMYGE